ncbi:hypothetical protein JHK85_038286 [Glycine max]|nr:hypothetical protein JHK85_038286 [Glycine max]
MELAWLAERLKLSVRQLSHMHKGEEWFPSSWKSADDPGQGEYSFKIDRRGFPQAVLLKGTTISTRFGPWNGFYFSGSLIDSRSPDVQIEFVLTKKETFSQFQALKKSLSYRFWVTTKRNALVSLWESQVSDWHTLYTQPSSPCEYYGKCGANSVCNANNPRCTCLDGFVAHINRSMGCVRTIRLTCNKDGFRRYTGMVLPDTSSSWYDRNLNLQQCKDLCLQNCSCTAYANLDISGGGSGCLLWYHDLIDLRHYPQAQGGQDIYIRYSDSELGMKKIFHQSRHNSKLRKEEPDLPAFDLPFIAKATDNFSDANKLGEGGFGPVYKAWRLWTEGRPTDLMDAFLCERCTSSEVIRCIHVGLLCVQQRPEDRPDMSAVVLMLNGDKLLPQPKVPGFYHGSDKAYLSGKFKSFSYNDVSLTVLGAR